jgi:hypothetical protein
MSDRVAIDYLKSVHPPKASESQANNAKLNAKEKHVVEG